MRTTNGRTADSLPKCSGSQSVWLGERCAGKYEKPYDETISDMKFLIVDDFLPVRRIISRLIQEIGKNESEEAENGAVALRKLRSGNFDFVITDINMPEMNGMELLAVMKSDPLLKRIPVLLVSGAAGAKKSNLYESAGADGYLSKPFKAVALKNIVEMIISGVSVFNE